MSKTACRQGGLAFFQRAVWALAVTAAVPVVAQTASPDAGAPSFCALQDQGAARQTLCSEPSLWPLQKSLEAAVADASQQLAPLAGSAAAVEEFRESNQRFEDALASRCEQATADCVRTQLQARLEEIPGVVSALRERLESEAAAQAQAGALAARVAAELAERDRVAAELAAAKAAAAAATQAAADAQARATLQLQVGAALLGALLLLGAGWAWRRRTKPRAAPASAFIATAAQAPVAVAASAPVPPAQSEPAAAVAAPLSASLPAATALAPAPVTGKKALWLVHPSTGQARRAPWGFSWTTFFFGAFVPLWRRDYRGFWMLLVLGVISSGLANIVFAFLGNKGHIQRLLKDGYRASAVETGTLQDAQTALGLTLPLSPSVRLDSAGVLPACSDTARQGAGARVGWAVAALFGVAVLGSMASGEGRLAQSATAAPRAQTVVAEAPQPRMMSTEEAEEATARDLIQQMANGRSPICAGLAQSAEIRWNQYLQSGGHPTLKAGFLQIVSEAERRDCL